MTRTTRHTRSGRLLGVAALTGCFLIGACGTGTGDAEGHDDGVASLATASPATTSAGTPGSRTAPTTTAGGDDDSSQLRLDSSAEDVARIRHAYATCLREHGEPPKSSRPPTAAEEKASRAAMAACQSKVPRLPPEMDPTRNPHYADAVRAEAKCLKDRGLKVHVVPAPGSDPNRISWTYDAMPGPDVNIQKVQDDCRVKAFGGGRYL